MTGSAEAVSVAASAGGAGAAVSMLGSALACLGSSAGGNVGAADVTWSAAPSLACTYCRQDIRPRLFIFLLRVCDTVPIQSLDHPSGQSSTSSDVNSLKEQAAPSGAPVQKQVVQQAAP